MPIQVFRCPYHGCFEVRITFKDGVPESQPCPMCGERSTWVPSAPNFIGGPTTGAENK